MNMKKTTKSPSTTDAYYGDDDLNTGEELDLSFLDE